MKLTKSIPSSLKDIAGPPGKCRRSFYCPMLNSDFSLSEARVLYEIKHLEHCIAKMLIEELSMDPGYLSRIIKRFEKLGLIYRDQSREDRRLYYVL